MSSVVIKKDVPQISTLNNLPLPIQADKDLLISNFTRELSFTTKTPQTIKDLQPVENKNPDTKQNTDTPQQKQVPEDSKTIREIKIVENIRKIEELIYGIPITKPIDVNSPTSDSKLVNEAKPLTFNQKFNLSEITNITNNLVAKLPDNGNYSAILHLKPESLGSVMIEMTLKNNMLNLTFKADSPEAARAIESQLANLSEKLSSNGIHTQSVEVSYGNEKDMTRDYGDQHQKTAKEERETKEELLKSYRMLQNMNNEYSEDLIMPGNFLRMMKTNQLYRN
jgi:flagellar hook-length control protein FliK